MNGLLREARDLARAVRSALERDSAPEVVLCPPFLALSAVREAIEGSPLRLGAQNLYWETKGAFTGEVSAAMLKDAGCSHVVIAHSERRHIMGETDEMANRKVRAALGAGLTPILCVGELLDEREKGVTHQVVDRQISKGLAGLSAEDVARTIVAYEPVWAIGTGKVATPQQAEDVHLFIRKLLAQRAGPATADRVRILYGGSVKPDNIKDLMGQGDIDGALVGGASLDAQSFIRIVRYRA